MLSRWDHRPGPILQGETARALIEATHFFCAPVANARVRCEIRPEAAEYRPDVADWWVWSTGSGWLPSDLAASGEAAADAQGRWLLALPAVCR